MGNKVQNKGVGGGEFSICPVLCYLQVLILLPPARASSPLLSWDTASPVISFSIHCLSPPAWKGSAGDISETDYFTLKQTSFFKDCFTNDAFRYICFLKFKRIQINFLWVFVKRENKKISSKLGVAVQGVAQEQEWLQAVLSMNSGSGEISSNSSICTFCARLGFEVHFFFCC